MSLLRLVRRNLLRHPVRTGLTVLAAVTAMFLLVFLRSLVTTLDSVTDLVTNRIVTQSAASLFVNLPESYLAKIEAVDGVESVSRWQWFGGYYRDPSEFFAQFGVDAESFLEQYPECIIDDEARRAFLADRRACIMGQRLADRLGFGVGDTIPITGTIFTLPDEKAWEFPIAGIYTSTRPSFSENTLFFHYELLRETLESGGATGPSGVGIFVVKLADVDDAAGVAARIDAVFAGGPQRTRTETEAAFQAGFITMLGNVPTFVSWIGGAVLFALVLTLINTMLISAAERLRDVGVLKALGFTDLSCAMVLLSESALVALGGGLVGLGLARMAEPGMRIFLAENLGVNGYTVQTPTIAIAIAVSTAAGVLGGLIPALRASRLDPAEALHEEQ